MTSQLAHGADKSSAPSGDGVFGVIANALQTSGRKLGCWDNTRLATDGERGTHGIRNADPTIVDDSLVYALATS